MERDFCMTKEFSIRSVELEEYKTLDLVNSYSPRRPPMKTLRTLNPVIRLVFASLILATALALLWKGASDPTNAQQSPTAEQERKVENLIPKHVPIDVKITKEKEKAW